MEQTHTLIIGAGVSGLSFANFTANPDYLIIERDDEIGGYCRTIKQHGFVWDYSGHFFHFRHPEIENYLVSRMPADEVFVIEKLSKIFFKHGLIDFPFQKNIHQLPKEDFIDCLYDLYFREKGVINNFRDMLYAKFGKGICERFLIPYNEKLYACGLENLDQNAMGRFFPYADLADIIRNFKGSDDTSYNATFTYPKGGAIEYIKALKQQVPDSQIALEEKAVAIDVDQRFVRTTKRAIHYQQLISSMPFDRLLSIIDVEYDRSVFTSNKVLVFNLGFDKKGWETIHWAYFPERTYCFYRVGFYDNIFNTDRMSLYVEIGLKSDAEVSVERSLGKTLIDLRKVGIVTDHELVAYHSVVLDPAYVHINEKSQQQVSDHMAKLNKCGIYSIGRYGGWKYCSIEDNIIEAKALAENLKQHAF